MWASSTSCSPKRSAVWLSIGIGTPRVRGLNHLTIAVSDLDRSLAFYIDLLGLRLRARWEVGAYLDAGDLWLCLTVDPRTTAAVDYTHFALDVASADFTALAIKARQARVREWQPNKSEGQSLCVLDPDGRRLELHVGTLQSRLDQYRTTRPSIEIIDIDQVS